MTAILWKDIWYPIKISQPKPTWNCLTRLTQSANIIENFHQPCFSLIQFWETQGLGFPTGLYVAFILACCLTLCFVNAACCFMVRALWHCHDGLIVTPTCKFSRTQLRSASSLNIKHLYSCTNISSKVLISNQVWKQDLSAVLSVWIWWNDIVPDAFNILKTIETKNFTIKTFLFIVNCKMKKHKYNISLTSFCSANLQQDINNSKYLTHYVSFNPRRGYHQKGGYVSFWSY